jgi:hypothetical protein
VKCSCGGTIVTTNKPRDGERAGCSRCQSCISIEWLLFVIDEQTEALNRAETKITRLYQRGADTTSALHYAKDFMGNFVRASREFIAALETENARLKVDLEDVRRSNEMACENPPSGCDCPGCSYAREESEKGTI